MAAVLTWIILYSELTVTSLVRLNPFNWWPVNKTQWQLDNLRWWSRYAEVYRCTVTGRKLEKERDKKARERVKPRLLPLQLNEPLLLWSFCRTRRTFSSCPSRWRDSHWRHVCLPLWEPLTSTEGISLTLLYTFPLSTTELNRSLEKGSIYSH